LVDPIKGSFMKTYFLEGKLLELNLLRFKINELAFRK
jgi:hypothetical protein